MRRRWLARRRSRTGRRCACGLSWSWPTMTVAPSAFRRVQVNRNGVSPGEPAIESCMGIVMSRIDMATAFGQVTKSGPAVRVCGRVVRRSC
jgi:hypothetical protein